MTKDETDTEEKPDEEVETPSEDISSQIHKIDIPDLLGCVKQMISSPTKQKTGLCEVHIVGTPEMILKILKIE